MNEFVKLGSKVYTAPTGIEYNLEPGVVYNLEFDDWHRESFLTIGEPLKIPSKIYKKKEDEKFIEKILNNFKEGDSNTTGVLLTGLKGSGKTVLAKTLATQSNVPIIVVTSNYPTRYLDNFFTKFSKTEICVIFDEIDKNQDKWDTEDLLGFLDGTNGTSKKLVIFTCNKCKDVNEYLLDRCSRIRYRKIYKSLSEEDIRQFVNFLLDNKDRTEEITKFVVENIKTLSYDNVQSFVCECMRYPEDSLKDLLKDMNINNEAL